MLAAEVARVVVLLQTLVEALPLAMKIAALAYAIVENFVFPNPACIRHVASPFLGLAFAALVVVLEVVIRIA